LEAIFAPMKNQKSIGQDYYLGLYQECKSRGIGIGAFCERSSVMCAAFRYWVKKFEQPRTSEFGFTELGMRLTILSGSLKPITVLYFSTGGSLFFYPLPEENRYHRQK
jgi:hypothetical protein